MPSELGALIRREREKRGIGLRVLADRIKKSPSLLVRIETDNLLPSVSEETLLRIAGQLDLDENLVMTLAKKVPKELAPGSELDLALYRKVRSMTPEQKRRLLESSDDAEER